MDERWVAWVGGAAGRIRATPLGGAVAQRLRDVILAVVVDELSRQAEPVGETERLLGAIRAAIPPLERRVQTAEHRLDQGPFHAGMTVHAAHDRHPGVAAIFAARGLPACPACAVGVDETLGEAAFGEGFAVEPLLAELNALLR